MEYVVWQRSIVSEAGNVLPSASVTVTDVVSGALAQLYSDEGVTGIGNPMTADSSGFAQFYVKSGIYDIVATSGATTRTWSDERIGSPHKRTAAEISAGVTPTNYEYPPGDIRRYGAVSGADSNTAIANAIKSNLEVWVPESGTFIFTSLRIQEGRTFYSKGGTLKFKDNTAVSGAASYYPITTSPDGSAGGAANNVTIRDLVIDGNRTNNGTFLVCDAITVSGENVKVLNNTIIDPPDSGVMFSGVKGSQCIGNYIENASDAGLYINDSNGSFDFRANVVSHNFLVGCEVTGIGVKRYASLLLVTDNVTYECGVGINTEDFGSGLNPNYVSICNNLVIRSGLGDGSGGAGYGINLQKGIGLVCNGNLIYDCHAAHIIFTGISHSSIEGNVIVGTNNGGTASYGIWSIPDTSKPNVYNSICHNKIYDTNDYGIYLQNNAGTANVGNKVSGNTVFGTADEAMVVSDTYTNGEICDNDLSGTTIDLDYNIANGTNVNNRVANNICRNGNFNGNMGWQTGSYIETYANGVKVTYGTGTPTVGTWVDGSISRETPLAAADGNNMVLREYVCTASGSPGTWVAQYVSTVSPAT